MDYTASYESPLGSLTLASDGNALVGLWIEGQRCFAAGLSPQHAECHELPIFEDVKRWLDCYFSGHRPDFIPPLAMRGTAFQQRVWRELLFIPYGQTTTYGDMARRFHSKMSAQAIGMAVGRNPMAIIVPCHRVVGANGELTGYSVGLERKLWLLRLEAAAIVVESTKSK